jgi:hypothetical protein
MPQDEELLSLALAFHARYLTLKGEAVAALLSVPLHAIPAAADQLCETLGSHFFSGEQPAHTHLALYSVPTIGAQLGFVPRRNTREELLAALGAAARHVASLPPEFFSLAPQPSVN